MPETTPHRPRPLVATAALLVVLAAAPPTLDAGKLAVFTDGRILEVEDAALEGDRVVLELNNGGRLEVAPIRLDRVIEAAPATPDAPPTPPLSCRPGWVDQPLPGGTPYRREIVEAARSADLHPWLLAALVQAESAFDPAARSRVGAAGLTQLMPATAADYRVTDVWDPGENLRGGARHLRALLDRFSEVHLALAAYNAGAATVDRAGGLPPYAETRQFVRRVLRVFCPNGEHETDTIDNPIDEGGH